MIKEIKRISSLWSKSRMLQLIILELGHWNIDRLQGMTVGVTKTEWRATATDRGVCHFLIGYLWIH
jgi:hypothetical protein